MKIAYFHYHLKTGGVTTVIRRQVNAVKDDCDTFVLTGDPENTDIPAEIAFIPGAGYDTSDAPVLDPEQVADTIVKTIFAKWKDGCDILHIHNPTLAKNKNFLKILHILKKRNINLFLQIHDFAEDGRPAVYFSEDDYPADCHYGVVNSRDYSILLQAGLKKEGLHMIYNNVNPFTSRPGEKSTGDVVLYPVRAIRRKNIGEAILLSLYFKDGETLAVTRPPNSAADIISYNGWKKFVMDNKLKVEFEASKKKDFKALVLSAKFLITTSINEGFGFSFLEPWTADKFLFGRKIPGICDDFENKGIALDHLYTKLAVPVVWIGRDRLYEKWKTSVLKNSVLFGLAMDVDTLETSFDKIAEDGNIDFGMLDEAFQKEVLLKIISNRKDKGTLASLNCFLSDISNVSKKDLLIKNNSTSVQENYSNTGYRERLLHIYENVCTAPVHHSIDKKSLLLKFLNLEGFSLLKWGDYVE